MSLLGHSRPLTLVGVADGWSEAETAVSADSSVVGKVGEFLADVVQMWVCQVLIRASVLLDLSVVEQKAVVAGVVAAVMAVVAGAMPVIAGAFAVVAGATVAAVVHVAETAVVQPSLVGLVSPDHPGVHVAAHEISSKIFATPEFAESVVLPFPGAFAQASEQSLCVGL